MNRRAFLGTLGVFSILPGAGRVWWAIRPVRHWVLVRPYYNYNDVERFFLGYSLPPTSGTFMSLVDGQFVFRDERFTAEEYEACTKKMAGRMFHEVAVYYDEQVLPRMGIEPRVGQKLEWRVVPAGGQETPNDFQSLPAITITI